MIATNNGSFPWRAADAPDRLDGAALDRITRETIDAQISAGLDLVTDGLVRRADPVSYAAGTLEGVALGEVRQGLPGSGAFYRVPLVHSEIAWKKPIVTEDFLFAKGGSARPVKPILLGPYTLSRLAEDRAYDDPMAMAMGFAIALNLELKALQAAGATWIQIDEPAILLAMDDFPTFTRLWEVLGRGVTVRLCLHLEGGDIRGLYPGIARLKRLSCLSLDCVRGPANLDLLRDAPCPETLMIGLGLVDGRSDRVEGAEALVSLLRSVPGLPPGDRIVLGTASDLGSLSPKAAFDKLRALAGARDLA
jgi:5-methyltetrahydropteroyltriglutamate--homocysteine methyltransferase